MARNTGIYDYCGCQLLINILLYVHIYKILL